LNLQQVSVRLAKTNCPSSSLINKGTTVNYSIHFVTSCSTVKN
jgi:hypothetical protein